MVILKSFVIRERLMQYELAITIAGRLIGLLANFSLFWLLLHILQPEKYAELALINGLQAFINVVVLGAIFSVLGREIWEWHYQNQLIERMSGPVFGLALANLIIFIFLVCIAYYMNWVEADSVLGVLVGGAICSIWIVLSTLLNTAGILRERTVFSSYLALDGIFKVLIVAIPYFLNIKAPVWAYFLIIQVGSLIGTYSAYMINHNTLGRYQLHLTSLWGVKNKFNKMTLAFILGSKSLRLASFFNWSAATGNRYILEPILTLSSLGAFVAGWGVGATLVGAVDGFLSTYMLPMLYKKTSGGANSGKHIRRENSNYLLLWLYVMTPLLAVFFIYSERLGMMIFGGAITSSVSIIRAGIVFMACMMLIGVFQSFSLVQRNLRPNMLAMSIVCILGLPLLGILTIYFGVNVGAWGLTCGSFLGCLLMILYFKSSIEWARIWRSISEIIIWSIFCSICAKLIFYGNSLWMLSSSRWGLFISWLLIGCLWLIYILIWVRPWGLKNFSGIENQ